MSTAKVFALANFSNQTISMGNNGQWVTQNLAANNVANTNEALVPPFATSDVMTINWENQTIAIWQNGTTIYWANWTTQQHTQASGIVLFQVPAAQQYNLVLCVYGVGTSLTPSMVQVS